MLENIKVSHSPHIKKHHSTQSVMLDVIIGLVPAMVAAVIFFRLKAVAVLGSCIVSCIVFEAMCNIILRKPNSLGDLSAVVTAIILAFSLPPTMPVWACVIGSGFAIIIGKMVFGGLGSNIFNPAMAGRCFLTACFGTMMTTWTVPATIHPQMPQVGQVQTSDPVATTQATPLALSKEAIKSRAAGNGTKAETVNSVFNYMFVGQTGGCLGETSALALIIGGFYMLIRGTINYIIPIAVLLSAFIFASIGWLIDPQYYIAPWVHLVGGGLLIGAFFIATDPVTAPLTKRGMWIFGIGLGGLTMLIRIVGEYPEGVMFAVLLMNAVTPLIDRFTKLTPTGGRVNA
ncbi:MAG: RnfABCDGE type electron transport complex subunit D [Sedimentisphaerales bacterium]|nr:RnfABCDGE type electron transport complex subunit D [Sedimentisphaerales bacterium]